MRGHVTLIQNPEQPRKNVLTAPDWTNAIRGLSAVDMVARLKMSFFYQIDFPE